MKKIVCFLLAVSLMLSLSVCAFASPELIPVDENDPAYGSNFVPIPSRGITPYALVPASQNPFILTARSGSTATFTQLVDNGDGLLVGSGGILSYIGSTQSSYTGTFYIRSPDYLPVNVPNYWVNFIGKITDANGYVLQPSDFNKYAMFISYASSFGINLGMQDPASDNIYQFEDGYLQIALSWNKFNYADSYAALAVNVSNSSVVGPLTFEVEKFEFYSGESSTTAYPFDFGGNAHIITPPGPVVKDPNDASQYGTAQDQVQWYNDAFGGAVDPELDNKIVAGNDMLLQQEEIEQDVIADFQQYSSQVDPANITFPTAVLNGMSFIGTTFMSSYNNLGDISFVISLSMMIGVVLVLIGRGEGALARGISSSSRERRRTEYASDRDMKKGG